MSKSERFHDIKYFPAGPNATIICQCKSLIFSPSIFQSAWNIFISRKWIDIKTDHVFNHSCLYVYVFVWQTSAMRNSSPLLQWNKWLYLSIKCILVNFIRLQSLGFSEAYKDICCCERQRQLDIVSNRKCQHYVYVNWENQSIYGIKEQIKQHLRHENNVNDNNS